jgi:enterochelin esterase family protein
MREPKQIAEANTPIIQGGQATFVWEGPTPPRLLADFNGWEQGGQDLEPDGPGRWSLTITLPEDAYVEYAFQIGDERLNDPRNPRKITNGMGKFNNYFAMPEARLDWRVQRRSGVPRGTVLSERVKTYGLAAGDTRRVYLYQPPVDTPCPLVLVWDGQDYLRRARIVTLLENLVAEGRVQPVALVMPEHGRQNRLLEYGCAEITLGFVLECLLPLARSRLNLLEAHQPGGSYGVLGASMGGLAALYAGLRLPGLFGKVMSQSGAFSFPDHDFIVWDLVRAADTASPQIWQVTGTMEWLLDCNRRMAALLRDRGFNLRYREYPGGHNYTCWRAELADAMTHFYPGEMVGRA